jgi:hypothetical protein
VRHREELGAAADDDPDPETLSSNQKESREVGGIPRPAREYYSQPAEPEDTPSALHPAQRNGPPLLNALTPAIRDKVAPVKINIHAYADRPADRFVIVDMKKYQVGDQIPGSGLVREIRADGLVLEHDGVRFQVPRP